MQIVENFKYDYFSESKGKRQRRLICCFHSSLVARDASLHIQTCSLDIAKPGGQKVPTANRTSLSFTATVPSEVQTSAWVPFQDMHDLLPKEDCNGR